MLTKRKKLMVLMPSYNKDDYIREAIDSVLSQVTDFEFELVVTDDGSTDKTISIVNEYIEKHPNKVSLLPSNKNQGLLSNIIKAYEYMDCEYFAVLDADDYLTDNRFYQKAVDFLEKNPDFNIYASNTHVSHGEDIHEQNTHFKEKFCDSTFEDMLNDKAMLGNTISSVFRNCVIDKNLIDKLKEHIGNQYEEAPYREDDFRNRIHLENSKAHYVNESVGVYRGTETGLYRGSNNLKKHLLKIISFIDMYYFFDEKYPKFIDLLLPYTRKINTAVLKGNVNNVLAYNPEDSFEFFNVLSRIYKINPKLYGNIVAEILSFVRRPKILSFFVKLKQKIKSIFLT